MNRLDPRFCVEVDVTNPGHFFACCGLLELAHRLWPGMEGWFEDGQFCIASLDLKDCSLEHVLSPLVAVEASTDTEWEKKGEAPVTLGDPFNIRLDWWLKESGEKNLFKTWAANATPLQMFCKWQAPLCKCFRQISNNKQLFHSTHHVQGSYGFDSDVAWNSLDVGFSLNEHGNYKKLPMHPAVEILGAIGLQRFFPDLNEQKQIVRYATWGIPLPPAVAQLVAMGVLTIGIDDRLRTKFVSRGSFKGLGTAKIVQGEDED